MDGTYVSKHSDEAEDDDELALVHRRLYDFSLALGSHLSADDAEGYLRQANKKWRRLREANEALPGNSTRDLESYEL